MQGGVGLAVTAAQNGAVRQLHSRTLAASENVQRTTELVQEAHFTRLAVIAVVVGVGGAHLVVGVRLPDQRARHAVTVRVGVVRTVQNHRVADHAIAVQVNAGRAAVAADLRVGLIDGLGAAAVGQHVLERGIDGQGQAVGQGEARLAADVSGVGRVDRRVGRLQRVAQVVGDALFELRQGHAAREAVAVLVVVTDQRDEVAVVAQRLIDAAVVLGLLDAARILEVIVFGARHRGPGAGAPGAELTGLHQGEDAAVVVAANRRLDNQTRGPRGTARDIIDGAAGGRGGGAVHISGAQVHAGTLDQFRIQLLVGIDGVVAGVIQRNAVGSQRDAGGVEAAHGDVATRRSVGVVVGEVDARNQVDRVQDALTGRLAADVFLRDGGAGLGLLFRDDGSRQRARATDASDDDFVDCSRAFGGQGAGGLGGGGGGRCQGDDDG